MLDELLIGGASADKESSTLVKTLIAALSSCNHYPDAQTTLVSEVKSALARALALPEGVLKHTKIQALTGLICTMIESCPSSQSHQVCYFLWIKNLVTKKIQFNIAFISRKT